MSSLAMQLSFNQSSVPRTTSRLVLPHKKHQWNWCHSLIPRELYFPLFCHLKIRDTHTIHNSTHSSSLFSLSLSHTYIYIYTHTHTHVYAHTPTHTHIPTPHTHTTRTHTYTPHNTWIKLWTWTRHLTCSCVLLPFMAKRSKCRNFGENSFFVTVSICNSTRSSQGTLSNCKHWFMTPFPQPQPQLITP